MMAIDKTGKWRTGDRPEDLEEYLRSYSAEGYATSEFRLARCDCGGVEFRLEADDNEGVARRTCTECRKQHFVCDSDEFWEDAAPEKWKCVGCKSRAANVGVGFALYDGGELHWLYLGVRCAKCGVLGCFAGWKIGYSPSRHLMERA